MDGDDERASLLGRGRGAADSGSAAAAADADGARSVEELIEYAGFGAFQVRLLFIAGFCWMADAMEVLLLSFLSPAVGCQWKLSSVEEASIVTVVFVGMMVGATLWGRFSDAYGRRAGYVATAAFTFVVGALSAFAPSYEYLLVFRGLVGVGVGGLHVAYTLFSEFLPGSTRSWTLLLLVIFWSVGSMFEAVLAWLTLPTDPFGAPGWHALLLFSALPMLGVLLLTPLVPESPRYLIVTGQEDRALAVLADVARANGRAPFAGKLLRPRAAEPGRVKDLLSGESHLRRTTLLLWALWFAVSFCYYGVVLLVTELFASNLLDKRCGRPVEDKSGGSLGRGSHIRDDCRTLFSASDFVDVFVTSAAELPGVLLAGLLLQLVGRKTAITVHFTGGAVSILLLYICTSRLVETIELATTRAFLTGAFQIIWIYTPEVYPTNVRSTGMGLCSSYARLGGMTTPFAAQVLAVVDVDAALALYAALMVVGAVLPFFLQVETRGQPMPETPHDVRNLMAGEDAPPPHDKVN